jgi:hypothetical protein
MNESPRENPFLFDLPLAPAPAEPAGEEAPAARRARRPAAERPESLPLFDDEELAAAVPEPEDEEPGSAPVRPAATSGRARLRRVQDAPALPPAAPLTARLLASAGDLAVLAAVAALAVAGARQLEAPAGLAHWPALGIFLLAWSFLYFVVALAFWGQTPGMAWAGLIARTGASEPLSFGQTARRWAATWITWALAGLPGLLALSGRSLVDRLSGSHTWALEPDAS